MSFGGKSLGVLPLTGTNGSGGRSPGSFLLPPAAFSPPWLGQWEAAGRELPERSWPMPPRHKALSCLFLANGSEANIFGGLLLHIPAVRSYTELRLLSLSSHWIAYYQAWNSLLMS